MPEQSQIVVANTTPIIALSLISHLDLMRQLYGEVCIPPAVRSELLAGGSMGIGVAEVQSADWIRLKALHDPRRAAMPDAWG